LRRLVAGGKGEALKIIIEPNTKARTTGSFQVTGPQTFQLGDIVEVQVSFAAIPLRASKWKICIILRGITLFEGRFAQVRTEFYDLGTKAESTTGSVREEFDAKSRTYRKD